MIQTTDHLPKEWLEFLQNTEKLALDIETVTSYVKIHLDQFPTDSQIKEYYEDVFCKSTNDASRKKWHQQDKNLLVWCVAKHLMYQGREELIPNDADWHYISKLLCVEKRLLELKWISLLHSNLKISPWSKEEDQILIEIANDCYQKNNWTELTIQFNSKSPTQRYPKQIRERWNNVLNPQIQRTTWTKEEKLKLITLILNYGKKWSKIQNELLGRSENQIKNQYNGIIRNLKRFNVQEVEERELLRAIVDNPDQKLSLTVTQFMSDLLAKKQRSNPQHDSNIQIEIDALKKVHIDQKIGTTVINLAPQEKICGNDDKHSIPQYQSEQAATTFSHSNPQLQVNGLFNYYQYNPPFFNSQNQNYLNQSQMYYPNQNYPNFPYPVNPYQGGYQWPYQQYSQRYY